MMPFINRCKPCGQIYIRLTRKWVIARERTRFPTQDQQCHECQRMDWITYHADGQLLPDPEKDKRLRELVVQRDRAMEEINKLFGVKPKSPDDFHCQITLSEKARGIGSD